MERGTYGIQFIVNIVLARLLLPEEFGLIVLITIFTSIAEILVQGGFNTALIQKKDTDEVDYSSVFYLNLLVAILLYVVLYITAPYIATFFKQPNFLIMIRILSLTVFFCSINSIQIAILSRNMHFKKLFISSFCAIIISGSVGIILAYASFGVWALLIQQLSNQFLITITLWFIVKWRPQFIFSILSIKSLFSLGWKLLISSLITALYSNLRSLIIAKFFSPSTLGFYNRGEQFPTLIVSNIDGSIQSVMLPTLSSHQDDKKRVKEIVRRSIVTSSFIVFPLLIGLAIISEPLIKILLTEKWLPAVPYMQMFCAVCALWPIHTANLQVISALGRGDIFLKIEIIKKVTESIILVISIPFGIYAIVWAAIICSIISSFINAYPNIKLIDYSLQEQSKDIFPSLLLSFVMGTVVYTIQWFELSEMLTIVCQVIVGIILYFGLAKIFKLECFTYLVLTLKERFKRNKLLKENTIKGL